MSDADLVNQWVDSIISGDLQAAGKAAGSLSGSDGKTEFERRMEAKGLGDIPGYLRAKRELEEA